MGLEEGLARRSTDIWRKDDRMWSDGNALSAVGISVIGGLRIALVTC